MVALIFDLEGVIIDSETLWDREAKEFFSRRGLKYDRGIKHLFSGMSVLQSSSMLKEFYHFPETPEKLAQERIERMKKLIKKVEFIPGFKNFVHQIRQYKRCIATSMDIQLLPIAVKTCGLDKIFGRHIISIADVGNIGKPNPDLFLFAAKKMKAALADCVVIEDSPLGILAAKRANMHCIALVTTYEKSKLTNADYIAASYSDMFSYLQHHFQP